jgi:surface antigen
MLQMFRAGICAAAMFGLTGCAMAEAPDPDSMDGTSPTVQTPDAFAVDSQTASIETPTRPLQCVPYARSRSGIQLRGDAAQWWDLADGHYTRSSTPTIGSVVVLTGSRHGHLAVVSSIDSPRQIRVDHANWMDDGRIYRNDPIVDVSPDNDWSEVRVWDTRDNLLGSRTYYVRGFIGPGPDDDSDQLASRE